MKAKPKPPFDYPAIEDAVLRAKVERAAHVGELIATGLVAAARPFALIARLWRPRQRLAPR